MEDKRINIKKHMKESLFHYCDIILDKEVACIENRPAYCDRGRFITKVFPDRIESFYVDGQDMFPRYYFDFDNMISELSHWFKAKEVKVLEIKLLKTGAK